MEYLIYFLLSMQIVFAILGFVTDKERYFVFSALSFVPLFIIGYCALSGVPNGI